MALQDKEKRKIRDGVAIAISSLL